MTQLLQSTSKRGISRLEARRGRLLAFLRGVTSRGLTFAVIVVATAWLPPVLLSGFRGWETLRTFLTDYASQSRFLIVLPVLILACPSLNVRLKKVMYHLEELVPAHQLPAFHDNWSSFERLRSSRLAMFVILLLTYATAALLGNYVSVNGAEIMPWFKGGGGGFRWMSPAGTWVLLVSYPCLVFFAALWLWRQLLWTRFMQSTTRLDLRLVAAHPDCLGGVGFLESALRGQQPFSFCLGAGLAGAVANRMFHDAQKLSSFIHVAEVLVCAVLLICVAPYFVFTPILMRMRRRGLLKYGAFARTAGEEFEAKWLDSPGSLDRGFCDAPDFAALHHLYGVVSNVNDISVLPVGRIDVYVLFAVAFVPAIPVVIGSVPFDVLAQGAVKLLF